MRSSDEPAAVPRASGRADLWWVGAATLASYWIASALELQETLSSRLARFERWQADEIPLTLIVLACGLAWYAFRRRRESQAQLALRIEAEARIAHLLARNRELAQQLISLQESERLALARELHDEFGQSCAALRTETAFLRHCATGDHEAMLACAQRADAAALSLYHLVRDLLGRLRPPDLDTLGLSAAIDALCRAWEARAAVACAFVCEGFDDDVPVTFGDVVNITLYRVAQEALTNVMRHAGASHVVVALALDAAQREVTMRIRDDGCGMDLGAPRRGFGLLGAVERVAAAGGELEIDSAPGAGLQLRLRIPLPFAASAAKAHAPLAEAV